MKLLRAMALLLAGTLASRVIGFLRELIVANQYGTSATVDVYLAATAAPSITYAPLSAALVIGLVSVFTSVSSTADLEERFNRTASNLLVVVLSVSGLYTVLMLFAVPWLTGLIAPGFVAEQRQLAQSSMLLALLVIPFWGVSAWSEAFLTSQQRFRPSALAAPLGNLAFVVWLLIMRPWHDANALIGGFLAAGLANVVVLWTGVVRQGRFRFRPYNIMKDPHLTQLGHFMLPVVLGQLFSQVNLAVDRMSASLLPSGTMAMVNYAQRLSGLPTSLIVSVFGTVMYPTLSTLAAEGRTAELKALIRRSLLIIQSAVAPAVIVAAVLADPIVSLVYQHGAFSVADTVASGRILAGYSLTILFLAWRELLVRGLYAMKKAQLPVWAAVISLCLHIALNFALAPYLGGLGLAVSASVAAVLRVVLLVWFSYRVFHGSFSEWKPTIIQSMKGLVPLGAMTASLVMSTFYFPINLEAPWVTRALALAVHASSGLFVYVVTAVAIKVEGVVEVRQALRAMALRVGRAFLARV